MTTCRGFVLLVLGVACALICTPAARADLVLHMPFDTDTQFDSVVGGITGTAAGDAAIQTAEKQLGDGAMYVDSTTGFNLDGVDIGPNDLDWTDFTIAAWVKLPPIDADQGQQRHTIFIDGNTTPSVNFWVGEHDVVPGELLWGYVRHQSRTRFFFLTGTTPITDNQWHHVAFTAKLSTDPDEMLALYLDGSPETITIDLNGGQLSTPVSSETDGYVGYWGDGPNNPNPPRSSKGYFDDFRIYDHALTEEEIGQAMVPEPSALVLLVTGLLGVGIWAWRRRR